MEVMKINVTIFEALAGLTPDEFCTWYKKLLVQINIMHGLMKEKVKHWQMKSLLGLREVDMVIGNYKVNLQSFCHGLARFSIILFVT